MITNRVSTTISKRLAIQALVAVVGLSTVLSASAAEYVVVANKGVSTSSLAKETAQAIFLGEKSRWDDDKPIKIAILEGSPASKTFMQNVIGKSPSQFDNYWKKLVFSGKAAAPKTFDDPANLIQFVSSTSGAVGFVAAGQAGASVKTISIK